MKKENRHKNMPRVSIIISNYNGKKLLRECLNSLRKLDYPNYEVIVVDCGSDDGSPDMVQQEFQEVKLIKTKKMGIGQAINTGFSVATGDYIIFDVNNDEIVNKDWLTRLVNALNNSPNVGIVGGKRYLGNSKFIDFAGGKINFFTGQTYIIGHGKRDSEEYNVQREVDFVVAPMARREVIDKIGLCDPCYYLYFEDSDFCIRAKQSGFKILYVPSAISWHMESATIGKNIVRKYYYLRRNQIRFIVKNFPLHYMIPSLILRLIFQTIFELFLIFPLVRKLLRYISLFSSTLWLGDWRGDIRWIKVLNIAMQWNFKNLRDHIKERYRIKQLIKARRLRSYEKDKLKNV